MDRMIRSLLGLPGITSTEKKALDIFLFIPYTHGRSKNERARRDYTDKLWACFPGRAVSEGKLAEINGIIDCRRALSHTEIAFTVCKLLSWKRPNGKLTAVEWRQFLERFESEDLVELSLRGKNSPDTLRTSQNDRTDPAPQLAGELTNLSSLSLSGPAWKMALQDRWIGWGDEQKRRNPQRIISNGRFLLLPWVRVKHPASSVLALALRQVVDDWKSMCGIRAVVVETLVDRQRFQGIRNKAASWIYLGATIGRDRMDHARRHQSLSPKEIYTLKAGFRRYLLTCS